MASEVLPNQLAWKQQIWFILIGLLGFGYLWFITSQHGIGVSPDSVGYLAVAQNLLEGKGFLSYQDKPFVVQPPLYPSAIAAISFLFGINLVKSALFLNLLLFANVVYLSGRFSLLVTNSFSVSIVVCISTVLGVPSIWISIFAWSELFFSFLTILSFSYFIRFISSRSINNLLACSFFINLSCLTRYSGLFSIFSVLALLLIAPERNIKRKIYHISFFLITSLISISLWTARNYAISGSFFGHRDKSVLGLSNVIFFTCKTFVTWFTFPLSVSFQNRPSIIVPVFLSFFTLFLFILKVYKRNYSILFLIIFTLTYTFLTFISSTYMKLDPVDNRLLSPVFIPLVIVLINFSCQVLYPHLKGKVASQLQPWLLLLGTLAWFTCPAFSTLALGLKTYREGVGYHAVQWQISATLAHVRQMREHLLQFPIYTNDPEGLYFLTKIKSNYTPLKFYPTCSKIRKAYFIYLNQGYTGKYPKIFEGICENIEIISINEFSDGAIYLVTCRES